MQQLTLKILKNKKKYEIKMEILKTALTSAIEQESFEIVKLLLKNKNINVNIPMMTKKNVYYYKSYDPFHFNPFKEDGLKFFYDNIEEKSPLVIAIEKGNVDAVKQLIEHEELDVNFINKTFNMRDDTVEWEKTTALNIAVDKENIEIVKLLLECKNLDVNFKNQRAQNKMRTALHTAVEKGNLDIIQLLLYHKNIDISIKDEKEKTPLEYSQNQQILHLFKNK